MRPAGAAMGGSSALVPHCSPEACSTNGERAPGRRAARASISKLSLLFAGEAGLPGACSCFSDTLLVNGRMRTAGTGALVIRCSFFARAASATGFLAVVSTDHPVDRRPQCAQHRNIAPDSDDIAKS